VIVGTYDEYVTLVTSGNGSVDPARGALLVHTLDCIGHPAAGVALSLDTMFSPGTDPFYFVSGSPVAGQTQTDEEGLGGFANVMTPSGFGTPQMTATLAANDEMIAVFTATVRPMTLTEIWLSPNL
jgi:hypothetical protein